MSVGGGLGAWGTFGAEDEGGQQSWIGGAWNWLLNSAAAVVSPFSAGGAATPPSHELTDEEAAAALELLDAHLNNTAGGAAPDARGGLGGYLRNSVRQVERGNYTPDEERTLLGTIGEIAVGFTPFFGTAASARDLSYDLTHWEWTWWHGIQTAGDLIGLIPLARGFTKTAGATARAIKGTNRGAKLASAASEAGQTANMLAKNRLTAQLAKSPLVSRILGKLALYPRVIDPRTGRHIPFPSGITTPVAKALRVTWGKAERAEFIAEWYRRGYPTPPGGWELYDIHHILPREFGGTNDFWNLVPVLRETHQRLFNQFWWEFTSL